jgi:hypothetical protein
MTHAQAIELPPDKRDRLEAIVRALREVPELCAIALGGSHARGSHRPDSDLDIGLYYRSAAPFVIDLVRAIARGFATAGTDPVVTDFGAWGPWVNGGAWIYNDACKIDLIYREIGQLETTVREAHAGVWRHDFDQQPPYGFRSVIYLGELACCVPLHDPAGILAQLKASVTTYPWALKRRIVADTLWAAEFSFLFARDFASRSDVGNTVGCMTRIAHYLTQAVFALNETYFISDKDAAPTIAGFALRPEHFDATLSAVLACPGATETALNASLDRLHSLCADLINLAGGYYQRRYVLGRR